MAAGAGAHRDQPVDAGFRGLAGVAHVDHVVEHQPAIALHRADQLLHGAERGDDQRHLVLDRKLEVGLHARIALVHDEIDAERRAGLAGVALDAVEPLADLDQPGLVVFARAVVERREGADDAGAAALHHEVRIGDEKHRRGDRGDRETAIELDGDRQGQVLVLDYSAAIGFFRPQARHDMLGEQLGRAARFLEREVAERQAAHDVVHARLVDLCLQLAQHGLRRARDGAAVLPSPSNSAGYITPTGFMPCSSHSFMKLACQRR